MMERNNFEEVKNFLAGTFHQDVEEPTEALADYIKESDSQWLSYISNEIECFLMSKISDNEKEEFILECTYIYYPAIGVTPMKWLEDVLVEIKKAIYN